METCDSDPAIANVTEKLRARILAEHAIRANRLSYSACHPPRDTEAGAEYYRLSEAYSKASSDLWMATDFECDRSPLRDAVWNWRYWSVMSRKCCWHQRFGNTWYAGRTMRKLAAAELRMVEVCGLQNIYRSSCSYLEEAFPRLKTK